MANIYDVIDPAELTQVARLILADEDRIANQFRLERWFPANLVDTITFEWGTGTTRTYTDAAPFRSFSVGPRFGTRPGRMETSGQMPPISIAYLLTELDLLKNRELAGGGPAARATLEGDIFADVERGIKAIENRMEIVRADLLVNGSSTLSENGIQLTLDAGRLAGRATSVGTVWSTSATATPMNDEETVLDTLQDEEGLGPQDLVVVTNRATWREYKATTQVKTAYPTFRVLDTISVAAANEVRQDNDFPEVVVYDAQVTGYDGVSRKVIPDGKWLFLPRSMPIGDTQYGVPASADADGVNLDVDQRPGPVAYMTEEIGPPMSVKTVVDALGVPVLKDPNATYALTV